MRLRAGLRVLRRGATEVQVGTDPRWAVRLPDLDPAEADLLQSVDARTDLTGLAPLASGQDVDPVRVRALVDALTEARLTTAGPPRAVLSGPAAVDAAAWSLLRADGDGDGVVRARAGRVVAVLGLGPTGLGTAVGLAAAGVGTVLVDDERPVRSTDVGVCGYRWSDAGSVREHVAARLLRDVAPHVSTASDRTPDVVVLVGDHVADPGRGPVLVTRGVAHLGVVVREADTVVGPSSCPAPARACAASTCTARTRTRPGPRSPPSCTTAGSPTRPDRSPRSAPAWARRPCSRTWTASAASRRA